MQTAVEMQFIAQAGLAYSKDPYDLERFARLRELAATMLSRGSGLPEKTVRDVFLCEKGYQTPKIDTRAAIVEDGRILLVAGEHRPVGAARRLDGRGHHHLPEHRQGGV